MEGKQKTKSRAGRAGTQKPGPAVPNDSRPLDPKCRRFDGQIVLVVGGAQGIGRAIALRLASEGAKVAIADIDLEQMQVSANQIRRHGGEVSTIGCDVRKKGQVHAAVRAIIRASKRIDAMIYVAGVSKGVPFVETTDRIWDWTIDINLKGAFWFAREVAKQMIKQRAGKMVFMASTNAWDAEAELAPYNVSKAGIFLLAKTLARELGHYGICSNAVGPGLIQTRLTEPFLKDPVFAQKYAHLIPLGRIGVPEDIAGPAVFLASRDANYVNGALLFVDGGQLA
jgi:NAD(P)-dependent dehydrogenase (short-subunit alcohol dehydrogenase family)